MKDFFKDILDSDTEWPVEDAGIGHPDPFDSPVWSGVEMMDFFDSNKIKKEDFTDVLLGHLNSFIERSSEMSIPAYLRDRFNYSVCNEEYAKEMVSEIEGTLTAEQLCVVDDASCDANYMNDVLDSRAEWWEHFFHSLYMFSCDVSFKTANGYDRPRTIEDTVQKPALPSLDCCDWPGVYAFKCNASGLIKIGMSQKSVKRRVSSQLTSLPRGGEFIYAAKSHNAKKLEDDAHSTFANTRIHNRREWFKCGEDDIVGFLLANSLVNPIH